MVLLGWWEMTTREINKLELMRALKCNISSEELNEMFSCIYCKKFHKKCPIIMDTKDIIVLNGYYIYKCFEGEKK